jgi:TP901 family phage tail tape measure protein
MTDFARLVLDADTRGLKRGEQDLDNLAQSSRRAAGLITGAFARIGGAIAGALAVSGGLSSIISTNAEFGASMQKVAAISGATGAEFDALREKALEMGSATQFSASQAADALGFLAMAGFSAAEAIEAIPDVLDLAAASGMDLAQAADIASNVLSGFGKQASEASQVADVLARAASSTNTSVSQLGQAMSTAAPIAAALGISMEETAAAIGVMSDAGIQGERAGTALRGIFASLAGPTKQARDALAAYGLSAKDVNPEVVGLANAMQTLRDKKISTADAMVIFGREAASGALVMAQTSDRIKELTENFENASGAAGEMAAVMRDNLKGDIDAMKSAMEGFIISIGDSGVTGGLRKMTQFGAEAIRFLGANLSSLINIVSTAVGGWATYRITLLAVQGTTVLLNSTLAATSMTLVGYTRNVGLLTAAKTGATVAARTLIGVLIANPFTAVAVAVGALTAAFISMGQAQAQARAETDNLIRSLRSLAQARSADFSLRRTEVDMERQRLETRIAEIEAEKNRIRSSPELAQRGTTGSRLKALETEARDLTWQVVKMEGELKAADRAFSEAEAAANSMVVPVAQAAAAMGDLGEESKKAAKKVKEAKNELADITERYFPEMISRAKAAELQFVRTQQALGRISNEFGVALRLRIIGTDAGELSSQLKQSMRDIGAGDLEKMSMKLTEMPYINGKFVKSAKDTASQVADSFAQMSERVVSSLQGLTNSIQRGDFLGILTGVLNTVIQLGGMGAFGKNFQTRVNAAPTNRSMGGPVQAGQPYMVGERGRETFVPGQSGRIVPNNDNAQKMHITFGVDPSGNITPFVNGQIMQAAPMIAAGGAAMAASQSSSRARRSVRR